MRCKRCGSVDIILFKDIHRCNSCDSTNIIGGDVSSSSKMETGQSDVAMRILLPVNRSGYAIAAGYLGLISILLIPAPFALLFGLLGVRDIRSNSEKHGMGRAIFGIVMGTIFLILILFVVYKEATG
jgi:hypothetical protein|tara:strand:- start:3012 stop:3392 length:381 start_codon:yes stop_codon:yes gene_type:complete